MSNRHPTINLLLCESAVSDHGSPFFLGEPKGVKASGTTTFAPPDSLVLYCAKQPLLYSTILLPSACSSRVLGRALWSEAIALTERGQQGLLDTGRHSPDRRQHGVLEDIGAIQKQEYASYHDLRTRKE